MTYKKYDYSKFDKEDDEDDVVEGTSNITLSMTKKLKDKLDYLSTHYTKSEIAGFITRKEIIKYTDGTIKIVLDDLLIPPQEAKTSEVDISGEGQIELYKEFGQEVISKIIGQWHSHHTMGCFFSSTDEDMMKEYSENKPFRIFIVSSEGKHLIRMVMKNTINEYPFEMKIENVEYEVEGDETIKLEMESEISKKVKQTKEVITTSTTYYSNGKTSSEIQKLKKDINTRIKYLQHQNHKVRVENIFKCYADLIMDEFKILNPITEAGTLDKHFTIVVELGDRNKAKEFMCDVKQLLLQHLLIEREKEEFKTTSSEEEDEGLEEYLVSELDDEERAILEDERAFYGYSGKCDWNNKTEKFENMGSRIDYY